MKTFLKMLAEHWEVVASIAALLWSFVRGLPGLLFFAALFLAILCVVHECTHWRHLTWAVDPQDPDREYLRRVLVVVHHAFAALVICIPVFAIGSYELVAFLPTWTDHEITNIISDKQLTADIEKDVISQAMEPCAHNKSHVGLVTPTAVTLFPSEPVFRILLRPYSGIPAGVASVSSLLLCVVLFVLWMADLILGARGATPGQHGHPTQV